MNENSNFNEWKIPLYKIYTDEEDLGLITKIVKRGTEWALGPEIIEFENAIKNYVGVDYCTTLNSGTSALHATLLSYNIKNSDEVIVPSFSFISTANSVQFVKAKPIFADIERLTLGLDPNKISTKISDKTKAIIPMDYGGMSCQIHEIKKIAKENNLVLIEDAAESLGSSINNKKIGSISDASIFSFCGNKVLTTGEGGAVVTNSKEIDEKIKLIRSHGRQDGENYFQNPKDSIYNDIGFNWRMSTITAALGLTQIQKLDKIISMRKKNANYIKTRLEKFPQIHFQEIPPNYDHIFQMFSIFLKNKKMRDDLRDHLTKKRIVSKVYFSPIHLTAFYKEKFGTTEGILPVTEQISKEILTIPVYPNMENEEKDYVIESISEFFE